MQALRKPAGRPRPAGAFRVHLRTPRVPLLALLSMAVAAVALSAAPAAAQAQLSSGTLAVQSIEVTKSILAPGESAGVAIEAVRSCDNPAQVLPAGTLQVHAVTQSGLIAITGPTTIAMEQLLCAQAPSQRLHIVLNATARSDFAESVGANVTKLDGQVVFRLRTDAAMPGSAPAQDASASAMFVVQAPPEGAAAAVAGEEQVAPGGGIVAGLLVLALGAFALRRFGRHAP